MVIFIPMSKENIRIRYGDGGDNYVICVLIKKKGRR